MTEKERLMIAQQQIKNISSLMKNNCSEKLILNYLITIDYELQRQVHLHH